VKFRNQEYYNLYKIHSVKVYQIKTDILAAVNNNDFDDLVSTCHMFRHTDNPQTFKYTILKLKMKYVYLLCYF